MDKNTQREIERLRSIANQVHGTCSASDAFMSEQAAALHQFNSAPTADGALARFSGRVIRNMARRAGLGE